MLFSSFDCTLAYVRKKEDPLNAIGSGFLTGAVLAARGYAIGISANLFRGVEGVVSFGNVWGRFARSH